MYYILILLIKGDFYVDKNTSKRTRCFIITTSFKRTFKPTSNAYLVLQDIFQQEYQSFRELFTDNSLLLALVKSEFSNNTEEAEIDRLENILETFRKNKSEGENK